MERLTKTEVAQFRNELHYMLMFSIIWTMIGEYNLYFSDYAIGIIIILAFTLGIGLYSLRLKALKHELKDDPAPNDPGRYVKGKKARRWYAVTLVLQGIVILGTWIMLSKWGYEKWLISGLAIIAGVHFFFLAIVLRQSTYNYLGAWTCFLPVLTYLMLASEDITMYYSTAIIAYGCAGGGVIDGLTKVYRIETRRQGKKW